MSPPIDQAGEGFVGFRDHLLAMVREVRKRIVYVVHILTEFAVAHGKLAQGTPKPNIFGQQFGEETFIEVIPHLVVESPNEVDI